MQSKTQFKGGIKWKILSFSNPALEVFGFFFGLRQSKRQYIWLFQVFATMHALRLHKGLVPGRDKARKARKLQQVTRQRDARGSILQGLRTFLTVDSFMYGPLMESPPIVTIHSDGSEPQTPDREQENGGFDDDTSWDYESREENDTSSGKNIDDGNIIRRYQGSHSNSKNVVSVQRTSARMTARTMLPLANGSCTPSSTARVPKQSRNGTSGTF